MRRILCQRAAAFGAPAFSQLFCWILFGYGCLKLTFGASAAYSGFRLLYHLRAKSLIVPN